MHHCLSLVVFRESFSAGLCNHVTIEPTALFALSLSHAAALLNQLLDVDSVISELHWETEWHLSNHLFGDLSPGSRRRPNIYTSPSVPDWALRLPDWEHCKLTGRLLYIKQNMYIV